MAKATLARKREDSANALLRGAGRSDLPSAMRSLCYDERDPVPGTHYWLERGLVILAEAWGLAPRRAFDA